MYHTRIPNHITTSIKLQLDDKAGNLRKRGISLERTRASFQKPSHAAPSLSPESFPGVVLRSRSPESEVWGDGYIGIRCRY